MGKNIRSGILGEGSRDREIEREIENGEKDQIREIENGEQDQIGYFG